MFDKNYMGHDLNDLTLGYTWTICKRCQAYIRPPNEKMKWCFAIFRIEDRMWNDNVITCDEYIIKNIIE